MTYSKTYSYSLLMYCLVGALSGCTTDLCTRHSDCPPADICGASGVCTAEPIVVVDASVSDAGLTDAMTSSPDAMAGHDAMTPAPDAMPGPDAMTPGPDAMPGPDAGATILDAGLVPPADASLGGMSSVTIPEFTGSDVGFR